MVKSGFGLMICLKFTLSHITNGDYCSAVNVILNRVAIHNLWWLCHLELVELVNPVYFDCFFYRDE